MYNLKEEVQSSGEKSRILGFNEETLAMMAKGYMDMGDINLEIANEMNHLESEADVTITKVISGNW